MTFPCVERMLSASLAALVVVIAVTVGSAHGRSPERAGERPLERADSATSLVPVPPSLVSDLEKQFGLPAGHLWGILLLEGGRVGECVGNVRSSTNQVASWDCGPAQINDQHVAHLAGVTGSTPISVRTRLRDDGPFNVTVAAYLAAEAIKNGRPGAYHSPNADRARNYEDRLRLAIRRLATK